MSEGLRVDHLVYAAADLEFGIDEIEGLLGVRAVPGGSHPGRGTRNALLGLGPRTYLEIIAPDPEQSQSPSWFGVNAVNPSKLVAWAAASNDLESDAAAALRGGVRLGNIVGGSRKRTDGVNLRWHYTDPSKLIADGIVPFLIDWGTSQHPANAIPNGGNLVELRAEHPRSERVARMLEALGIEMRVAAGESAVLIATIESARGRIHLR